MSFADLIQWRLFYNLGLATSKARALCGITKTFIWAHLKGLSHRAHLKSSKQAAENQQSIQSQNRSQWGESVSQDEVQSYFIAGINKTWTGNWWCWNRSYLLSDFIQRKWNTSALKVRLKNTLALNIWFFYHTNILEGRHTRHLSHFQSPQGKSDPHCVIVGATHFVIFRERESWVLSTMISYQNTEINGLCLRWEAYQG